MLLFHSCFLWEMLILGTSVSCDVVIPQFGHQNTVDPPAGWPTVILCPMWQLKKLEGRIELGASTQSVNLMYGRLSSYESNELAAAHIYTMNSINSE